MIITSSKFSTQLAYLLMFYFADQGCQNFARRFEDMGNKSEQRLRFRPTMYLHTYNLQIVVDSFPLIAFRQRAVYQC